MESLMIAVEENKPKPPRALKKISRRCPKCNWFLFEAEGIEGTINSEHLIEIRTRCANRKCTRKDSYTFVSEG